jgi:hypothetical protein
MNVKTNQCRALKATVVPTHLSHPPHNEKAETGTLGQVKKCIELISALDKSVHLTTYGIKCIQMIQQFTVVQWTLLSAE